MALDHQISIKFVTRVTEGGDRINEVRSLMNDEMKYIGLLRVGHPLNPSKSVDEGTITWQWFITLMMG